MITVWENGTRPLRAINAQRPLTRSLDLREEGLAMQATRTCSVTDCDRAYFARQFCKPHYVRWQQHGDPLSGTPVPTERLCSVDGCERPHRGHDLCSMHLQRMQRSGTTERVRQRRTCVLDGCDRPRVGHGWCRLHYGRWERNGDPLIVRPNPAMLPGALNCKWRGDVIGYTAAHDRIRAALGPATDQPCMDCGSIADGWSYDHRDPEERVEPGDPKHKAFSVKPEHYQARCHSCHWRVDHPTGKRTRA